MAPTTPYANIAGTSTALKALTSTQRTDKYTILIEDNNDFSSLYAPSSWYAFMDASTEVAMGQIIFVPNDNPTAGRWYKLDDPLVTLDAEDRTTKPPFSGIRCDDGTNGRTTYYYSVGNTSPSDWIIIDSQIRVGSGNPAFTANFVGELAYDSTSNALFIAEAETNSNWIDVVTGTTGGGGGGS